MGMAGTHSSITYHLVPRDAWQATDPDQDYAPPSLAAEGFIHTTEAPLEVLATARRHFTQAWDTLVVLVLDRERIKAPVRFDDAKRLYPHIYGPLNRDAILEIVPLPDFALRVPEGQNPPSGAR